MRPLEYGVCPNGELEHARIAGIKTVLPLRNALRTRALRAYRAVRPKPLLKIGDSGRFIGKLLEELESAYCASAH